MCFGILNCTGRQSLPCNSLPKYCLLYCTFPSVSPWYHLVYATYSLDIVPSSATKTSSRSWSSTCYIWSAMPTSLLLHVLCHCKLLLVLLPTQSLRVLDIYSDSLSLQPQLHPRHIQQLSQIWACVSSQVVVRTSIVRREKCTVNRVLPFTCLPSPIIHPCSALCCRTAAFPRSRYVLLQMIVALVLSKLDENNHWSNFTMFTVVIWY